jgi:hypothetical protein
LLKPEEPGIDGGPDGDAESYVARTEAVLTREVEHWVVTGRRNKPGDNEGAPPHFRRRRARAPARHCSGPPANASWIAANDSRPDGAVGDLSFRHDRDFPWTPRRARTRRPPKPAQIEPWCGRV